MSTEEKKLREQAIEAAIKYYQYQHASTKKFTPGDRIPYGGRVFDENEIVNLIDASLDPDDPTSWTSSVERGGTPGSAGIGNANSVVINEVFTNTPGTVSPMVANVAPRTMLSDL